MYNFALCEDEIDIQNMEVWNLLSRPNILFHAFILCYFK